MKPAQLSLDEKAKSVLAHVASGEKLQASSGAHYRAAGILLLDIQRETKGGFDKFLQSKLANVGRSRAYELMQIAGGRKTVADIKKQTRDRVKKHRDKKKLMPEPEPEPEPSVTVTDDEKEERAVGAQSTKALQKIKDVIGGNEEFLNSEDRKTAREYAMEKLK
jgi:hypothetical protein